MDLLFSGLSIVFSFALYLLLALNLFGLPANWFILGVIALWEYFWPLAPDLSLLHWTCLIGLALAGEGAEMFFHVIKARKYGSSKSGTFASVIGAIIGAILLSSVFWGLGALIGALLGSFIACYIMERLMDHPPSQAIRSAWGAMVGCFLGTVAKIGLGALIIFLANQWLWPKQPILPDKTPTPQLETVNAIHQERGDNSLWYSFS